MIAVAGEMGDGWIVHPLNSPSYVRAVRLPALERGLARPGRGRVDVEIACQTIVTLGATDEELARAEPPARLLADLEQRRRLRVCVCDARVDGEHERRNERRGAPHPSTPLVGSTRTAYFPRSATEPTRRGGPDATSDLEAGRHSSMLGGQAFDGPPVALSPIPDPVV
jgi:alkanesulfonate monooxygenase SsuD/methylene tetrahydromethanopterin reductase-like flavin-dependent oxidoreductase (luciferase family)